LLRDGDRLSSDHVNNVLMQLRKISLHPYLFQDSYARDDGLFHNSGKTEALDRLLPKLLRFDHKVVIFSQFTSVLTILEELLKLRGIQHVRLDGQVSHEQRSERINRFNSDPALRVFLLTTRAGGLGLNLQSADTVVLFDLDWNPQSDKQAVARVHRVGQTREVRIVRLVTDSAVERHMEARCGEKLELEQKVMGAGMFRRQATAEQRGCALRTVLGLDRSAGESDAAQDATSLLETRLALTEPAELNRQLARGPAELDAFNEMDAKALQPQDHAGNGAMADADIEARLIQSGRLMNASQVPRGFSAGENDAS